MWADSILIVFISVCTALLGEGNFIFSYLKKIMTFFVDLIFKSNKLKNYMFQV